MIEVIMKELLDLTGYKALPVKLPEDVVYPAMTYQVNGFNTTKVLEQTVKAHATRFRLNLYANSYAEAKAMQSKVIDVFDDLSGTYTHGLKEFSVLGEILDIKDLFEIDMNQIVIDISLDYFIN